MGFHNWRHGVSKVKSTLQKEENPLRIGILGAANINHIAIIDPVQTHPGAVISGIAARDRSRAQAQIDKYRVEAECKTYASYDELIAEPSIQAVYIPLPNGLHHEWAVKALEAGKHVLIEKPIASNAEQTREIQAAAIKANKIALEAYHWRFHSAAHHVKSIVESGKYGKPTSISSQLSLPAGIVGKDDIRLKYDLAGGACMDLAYVFSSSTYFASPDISKCTFEVVHTAPHLNKSDKRIDESMASKYVVKQEGRPEVNCQVQADLFPRTALFGFIPRYWDITSQVNIELEKARIKFDGFVIPTFGHTITITDKGSGQKSTEKLFVDGPQWKSRGQPWWTTYRYQLEAFVESVKAKEAGKEYQGPWMKLSESEKIMELIDAVYDHAGLPERGT